MGRFKDGRNLQSPLFTPSNREHLEKVVFSSKRNQCLTQRKLHNPSIPKLFLSPENKLDLLRGDQSKSCLSQWEVS